MTIRGEPLTIAVKVGGLAITEHMDHKNRFGTDILMVSAAFKF